MFQLEAKRACVEGDGALNVFDLVSDTVKIDDKIADLSGSFTSLVRLADGSADDLVSFTMARSSYTFVERCCCRKSVTPTERGTGRCVPGTSELP